MRAAAAKRRTAWPSQVLNEATYTYDGGNNRTDRGAVIDPASNRVTAMDGFTLSYDDDGNLVRKLKTGVMDQTFEWNSLSQLVRVTTNGSAVTFGYDAWGRRVRKTVGSSTTRYLHDGLSVVAELDGAGAIRQEYSYYPGIDRPLAMRRADGAVFYFVREEPGSIVGLVDANNVVVNTYKYTPYGESLGTTGSVAQPYRFMGRELDQETGLYYFRNRYYDPTMGRFISADPVGLAAGLNPYTLLNGNPSSGTDPLGLDGPCPTGFELVEHAVTDVSDGWQHYEAKCVNKKGEVISVEGWARIPTLEPISAAPNPLPPYQFDPGAKKRGYTVPSLAPGEPYADLALSAKLIVEKTKFLAWEECVILASAGVAGVTGSTRDAATSVVDDAIDNVSTVPSKLPGEVGRSWWRRALSKAGLKFLKPVTPGSSALGVGTGVAGCTAAAEKGWLK